MPAWPGGACPECGEDMPARMVRCRNCRAMLNTDLDCDTVEIPAFVPLKEIKEHAEVAARGIYHECESCHRELRVNGRYVGTKIACKLCGAKVDLRKPPSEFRVGYVHCPHCEKTLRINFKYVGQVVACRFCEQKIELLPLMPGQND
ncbi:hypothetical protein [Stratiformator vulcanicus]|uniref:Double zinc ribbon n=1 Tax=Stratiformator vulcanicus TaxID=2527980 RepID=A0A517R6V4_9PLAN|nr:hypothetical protein [Stratiformator vulcanicus]QDT39561.1 Double zinc ribbon [Stratiformator vulcanicus]